MAAATSDTSHKKGLLSQDNSEFAHLRQLAASLDDMRRNDTMTDITLVCGEREFPAHRLVLAASSPYFRSMFRSEWKDRSCERHELCGWSPATAASVLSFMYTGRVSDAKLADDKEALTKLLEAADYFQVEELVDHCFNSLSRLSLNSTHFWDLYGLADKFNNQRQIPRTVKQLFADFANISQSEEFLHLNKRQLQTILQHPDVDLSCMNAVFAAVLKWTEFEDERYLFLKEFINTFDVYWCQLRLSDLVRENLLKHSWTPRMRNILSDISVSRCPTPLTCHQQLQASSMFVCFGENLVHTYDLKTDEWLISRQPPFYVDQRAATVSYNRHIFFFGGALVTQYSHARPTTIIQHCLSTNAVVEPASVELVVAVNLAGASVLNDFIYVVNGQKKKNEPLDIVQCYDPNNKTCKQVSSTVKRHLKPLVFGFESHLYVFADTTSGYKNLERYDPVADQWTELIALPVLLINPCSTISGTKIFSLNSLNCDYQFYTLDVLSLEQEIVHFDGGPDLVKRVCSAKNDGKHYLLAVDLSNTPFFYDIQNKHWVKNGQSCNGVMFHSLSCCV